MSADTAMNTLPNLLTRLNALGAHLADESAQIEKEWIALGKIGAQRADHAANLLARLQPHLADIERFASACGQQIEAARENPFGD